MRNDTTNEIDLDSSADNDCTQYPTFSYFKAPISNIIPTQIVNLLDVYLSIKSLTFKPNTETLRDLGESKKAKDFKAKSFDYVTFSGIFHERSDSKLIRHSGLMVVDFDKISDLLDLKTSLLEDKYFDTELLFKSPSGTGLKWVISVDLSMYSHKEYFQAIFNYIRSTYKIEIDKSGKDISRACFLPHDKDAHINPKYIK